MIQTIVIAKTLARFSGVMLCLSAICIFMPLSAEASSLMAVDRARSDAIKSVVDTSAAFFRGGDFQSGLKAVEKDNHSAPATGDWHYESSQRLVEVALCLSVQRDARTARQVADCALSSLQAAAVAYEKTNNLKGQAQVLASAAFIYDHFFCDFQMALFYHQRVLRIDPASTHSIREAARLTRMLATLPQSK